MENCRFGPNGDGSDETIDQFADGCSGLTAAAIDGRRVLVVSRCRRQGDRTRKQPPEPPQVPFVARTGQDFHANHIAGRQFTVEQGLDPVARR